MILEYSIPPPLLLLLVTKKDTQANANPNSNNHPAIAMATQKISVSQLTTQSVILSIINPTEIATNSVQPVVYGHFFF